MSPTRTRGASGVDGFPRVSGDEPTLGGGDGEAGEFSPRERG